MNANTVLSFLRNGRLRLLLSAMRLVTPFYRVSWVAAAARHGVLRRLAEGAAPLDRLVGELAPGPGGSAALAAWLEVGVQLGEIESGPAGYRLRGFLARGLARPEHDALAAMLEEIGMLHHDLIARTPERLQRGQRWTLADQDGVMIARSSRVIEPLVVEAIDGVLPRSSPVRLLEVGAGSGTYIRHAAARNPQLAALGLELQPEVAELANRNLREWGLAERARVEPGDVRHRRPERAFDLVTLHNNIYYFAVEEREALFRHLREFVKPGGQLLVTTGCQGGSLTMHALDLWSASTEGCGRLPYVAELQQQLSQAGFTSVRARKLMPGESYYAFSGLEPE